MRVNAFEDLKTAGMPRDGFRSGNISFRDLMQGAEGSADNYGLQWVQVPDRYSAPRHRHNFEQVRVMLEGEFGFGAGLVQRPGSVGYFCEGTYYTQAAEGSSTTLLLQIGGPSRQGFMNRAQLLRGVAALAQKGSFEAGVFSWHDDHGKLHRQDSYEAVWEHVHGRPVHYPRPQYQTPIVLEPERFEYLRSGVDDADVKHLGRFNDHGLQLRQIRLAAGARHLVDGSAQAQLLFCLSGAGHIGGKPYGRWTTAEVSRGETVDAIAAEATEWFAFGLPHFGAG